MYIYSIIQRDYDTFTEYILLHEEDFTEGEFKEKYNESISTIKNENEVPIDIDASDIVDILCRDHGFNIAEPSITLGNSMGQPHRLL